MSARDRRVKRARRSREAELKRLVLLLASYDAVLEDLTKCGVQATDLLPVRVARSVLSVVVDEERRVLPP